MELWPPPPPHCNDDPKYAPINGMERLLFPKSLGPLGFPIRNVRGLITSSNLLSDQDSVVTASHTRSHILFTGVDSVPFCPAFRHSTVYRLLRFLSLLLFRCSNQSSSRFSFLFDSFQKKKYIFIYLSSRRIHNNLNLSAIA